MADAPAVEKKEEPFTPNPKDLDGAEDLSLLVYLEMRNVLYNLEFRFLMMEKKEIYTCVSTILLAVNPYEWLTYLTAQDMIDVYKKAQDTGDVKKTPHPFSVSSRAYVRMLTRNKPQSLLCCGISGAGKSECAKQLMRYLAKTSPIDMDTGGDPDFIVTQLVQASIVLEGWGNAKTTLNNNSSRFGKFMKLMYSKGAVLGSFMETYLLEKSRVVMQNPQERNYHLFYFLFKGLDSKQLGKLSLVNPKEHYYLKQGGCVDVAGMDDGEGFDELMTSLKLFRFSEDDLWSMWELTAAILHLGDCDGKEDDEGNSQVKNKNALAIAAKLWKIDKEALNDRLTTASMEVMKKIIIKKVPPSKYKDNRDAIAKALFENNFLFVVERMNAELFHIGGDVSKVMFIGILDIFGFENFVINSLEQFCINFTNEKIQGFFNYNIIQSEQEEYIAEAVLWKPLKVPDNSDFVSMIENKKKGMFALLDSSCKAPKPAPSGFFKEFQKNQGHMKQYMEKAKGPKSGGGGKKKKKKKKKKGKGGGGAEGGPFFTIHHFCDDVIYDCSAFLDKNMDAIHVDTTKMFVKSECPMVQMIGASSHKKKKKKKKKKAKSVTGLFSQQLITLIKTLSVTEPYFCRAMKPNWNKSAKEWDSTLVTDQLRSGGLIEALRVLKLGYPTRVPYQHIWDAFHDKMKNPLVLNLNQMGFAEVILSAFGVNARDYELGLTKVFFKPSKAAVLDKIMKAAGRDMNAEQIDLIENFVKHKRMKQLIGCLKTYMKLNFRMRRLKAQVALETIGRVIGYLGIAILSHLKIASGVWEEKEKLRLEAERKTKEAEDAAKAAAEKAASEAADEEAKAKIEAEHAAKAEEAKAGAEAAAKVAEEEHQRKLEEERQARSAAAADQEAQRAAAEKSKKDKENSELWKLMHPQATSESEGEHEAGGEEEEKEHERAKVDFRTESSHGHLFTVWENRKDKKPHERFVKCAWKGDKCLDISWGSGNRTMKLVNVMFVIKGKLTPTMKLHGDADGPDDDHAFSLVCSDGRTLDLSAGDDHSRDLWADGLTKALGQTEEERANMQEHYEPITKKEEVGAGSDITRTPSQKLTRIRLVKMIAKSVIREWQRVSLYPPACYSEVVAEEFVSDEYGKKIEEGKLHWKHWEFAVRQAMIKFCVEADILPDNLAETVEDSKIDETPEYGRYLKGQEPAGVTTKGPMADCKSS